MSCPSAPRNCEIDVGRILLFLQIVLFACGLAAAGDRGLATLESFGAIGGDGLDDTSAINAALAAGKPLTGNGALYDVSGPIVLPDGTDLRDAGFRQRDPGGTGWRTLTNAGAGPITLTRVTVDRNGSPSDGSIRDAAGMWFGNMTAGLRLEDVEVFGYGRGIGIMLANVSSPILIRPYVHDMQWSMPTDPKSEQIVGIFCVACADAVFDKPRIENLTGVIPWSAGDIITTARGVQYRFNGANAYKAANVGTTAEPGPSHTSGALADGGGVEWTYVGPTATTARAYQTDGIDFSGTTNAVVTGGSIVNVWEGVDVTGSGVNRNIWLHDMRYTDIDAFGEKWAHRVIDSGSTASRVERAGLGAFVIAGADPTEARRPDNVRLIDPVALDTGANGNWSSFLVSGFYFAGAGPDLHGANLAIVNGQAIDRQAVKTMKFGFRNEPNLAAAGVLINPSVAGATETPYLGFATEMLQGR